MIKWFKYHMSDSENYYFEAKYYSILHAVLYHKEMKRNTTLANKRFLFSNNNQNSSKNIPLTKSTV